MSLNLQIVVTMPYIVSPCMGGACGVRTSWASSFIFLLTTFNQQGRRV